MSIVNGKRWLMTAILIGVISILYSVGHLLLTRHKKTEPPAFEDSLALRAIPRSENDKKRQRFSQTIIEQTLESISGEPDNDYREILFQNWMRSRRHIPIPELLLYVEQVGNPESRSQFRLILLKEWAVAEPRAALTYIQNMAELQQKDEAALTILQTWIDRDPREVISWFGEQQGGDLLQLQAKHLLIQNLAERNPAGTLDWMEETLTASARAELYPSLFQKWAQASPWDAAAAFTKVSETSDLLSRIVDVLARTDSTAAIQWLDLLPDSAAKIEALIQAQNVEWAQKAKGRWAVLAPETASLWAAGLPEGNGKEQAVEQLIAIWNQLSVEQAANFVATLPAGEIQDGAAFSVISTWASTDPERTAAWTELFPEGALREQAFERLISSWAADNAGAAASWLQRLPPSRSRDMAVATFSRVIALRFPETAKRWAETVQDEMLRRNEQR